MLDHKRLEINNLYDDESADEEWYYFKSNGKRAEGEKITYKGKTYYFDSDGKMLTGWVTTGDSASAVNEANGYEKDHTFYCDETGAVEGAWVKDTNRALQMMTLMKTSTGTT